MGNHEPRSKIIERANRLLKQSKTLRKLSADLLTESNDIRAAANQLSNRGWKKDRRKRSPS
jgi:hypothetical protein